MRKIEREMCSALQRQVDWRKSNTSVRWNIDYKDSRPYADIRLHGNLIGEYWPTEHEIIILDAGWQSVTTKSRLNALCTELVNPRAGVFQSDWQWYIIDEHNVTHTWTGHYTLTTN